MPMTSFISMALTKVTTIWHFTVFTLYSHIIITTTINKSRSFKTGLPKIHKPIKFIFTIFKLLQIFLKGFTRFLYRLHDPIQLQLLFFNLLQWFDALSRYSGPDNGETYCRIPEQNNHQTTSCSVAHLLWFSFYKKGLSLIHKSNQHHWNTYPHPREMIPFSFKIPPSRDTAPCLIQVCASIMSLRVLYTWSSPKSRYNKVSRRPFPALVLMCMWWSSRLTILTAYPTKPAGIFPFGKVGAGKANFLCGSLLPNFPEYGLPNQLENLNHYHKLLITCNVCIQYIDFFFSFLFLATGKLNIIPYTLKAYNKVSAINRLSKCSCCGM